MQPIPLSQTPSAVFDLDTEIRELREGQWCHGGAARTDNTQPIYGELWLMKVIFTDGCGAKIRPALVLAQQGPDLLVVPLTKRGPRDAFDVAVSSFRESGLFGPGTVRCSRLRLICGSLASLRVGRLAREDLRRVEAALKRWFAATFHE